MSLMLFRLLRMVPSPLDVVLLRMPSVSAPSFSPLPRSGGRGSWDTLSLHTVFRRRANYASGLFRCLRPPGGVGSGEVAGTGPATFRGGRAMITVLGSPRR